MPSGRCTGTCCQMTTLLFDVSFALNPLALLQTDSDVGMQTLGYIPDHAPDDDSRRVCTLRPNRPLHCLFV